MEIESQIQDLIDNDYQEYEKLYKLAILDFNVSEAVVYINHVINLIGNIMKWEYDYSYFVFDIFNNNNGLDLLIEDVLFNLTKYRYSPKMNFRIIQTLKYLKGNEGLTMDRNESQREHMIYLILKKNFSNELKIYLENNL